MAAGDLILAVDQGTGSSKALLVDHDGAIVATASASLGQATPQPGWVEQSPDEIWTGVRAAAAGALEQAGGRRVVAVGLSTQRESLVLWERSTGRPVGPLVSWQDQRTASVCETLARAGHGDRVRELSGLPLDPMFSATKAQWLLDAADPDRSRSRRGELCLGTVDSWVLSRSGGEHVIEVGNAARTQLLDIRDRDWDPELLELFRVPLEVLPRVVPSTGPFAALDLPGLTDVPVAAVMGDSHAALFAHAGWQPGTVKATYGTGSSVMGLCAPDTDPGEGLCLTVAWQRGDEVRYAVEGNIRSSGATLRWLADLTGRTPAQLADLAADATSGGVHIVPAFGGLGAPWWDRDAAGLISGLTLSSGPAQLARAALESIALQVEDVVAAVDRQVAPVRTLFADGGASANSVLMQLQADLSGRRVARALAGDLSPLGAAHLAGVATGFWTDDELHDLPRPRREFTPRTGPAERTAAQADWHRALGRARHG